MNEEFRSALWQKYEGLIGVAEQTVESMGKECAWTFMEIGNDWIELNKALISECSDELDSSLVFLDFIGLSQQIRWLQLLFFGGSYPMIYRNLRFVWELALRAYYTDTFAANFPDDPNPPGPTLDEKTEWLEGREHKLSWTKALQPTLTSVLQKSTHNASEDYYLELWRPLNSCVHPSEFIRFRMINIPFLNFTNVFEIEWADESLDFATKIFDLIWLTVLSRFPNVRSSIDFSKSFRIAPLVREGFHDDN